MSGGPAAHSPVSVLQVMRRPFTSRDHSIEGLFETVRAHLPSDVRAEAAQVPRPSQGVVNRLVNLAWMRTHRTPITHITGDVTYLAAALPRHGSVITIHDTGMEQRSPLSQQLFRYAWIRMPASRAERVTVVSDGVRDAVLEIAKVDPAKVTVIPNCVDPMFVPPAERPTDGPPVVLQVGTSPNKNLDRVASALSGLDCELHVIGPLDGEQRAMLEHRRIRYRVSTNLPRSDVVRAYQQASLVLFASTFEGFGMVILEAQAVGCPVITSDLDPMATVAGGGACLVDPFHVDSIREGVRRTLGDSGFRDQLCRRGKDNVAQYSAVAIAAQYASLYREMAGA